LFIIGGASSSNTNKLYEISKRIQPKTFFIEKAAQITPEMLSGAQKVGISGEPPLRLKPFAKRCLKSKKASESLVARRK
jgi:hypothetical protein